MFPAASGDPRVSGGVRVGQPLQNTLCLQLRRAAVVGDGQDELEPGRFAVC